VTSSPFLQGGNTRLKKRNAKDDLPVERNGMWQEEAQERCFPEPGNQWTMPTLKTRGYSLNIGGAKTKDLLMTHNPFLGYIGKYEPPSLITKRGGHALLV